MLQVIDQPDGRDGVRLLVLDRPDKRNAFDRALYAALTEALVAATADDGVRAVVLTGSGPVFTAGQDLDELTALAADNAAGTAVDNGFSRLLEALTALDKPLVVAVNGPAVGLGMTVLAHADLVLVSDTARMRVPFATFGVPPEAASSYLLPQRLGWQRAALILLTGDWLSAEDAVTHGLALSQHPGDRLLPDALDLAGRIASASLDSLRTIKGLMRTWQDPQVTTALERESAAYRTALGTGTAAAVHADRQG